MGLDKPGFTKIFQKSDRYTDTFFRVLIRKNSLSHSRLGIGVSKKYVRLATERNRIKRLIRESFYQKLPFPVGIDVVVIAGVGLRKQSNDILFGSLYKHWQKITNRLSQEIRRQQG